MNKVVKNGEIKLCDKFKLTQDGFKGLVLVLEEERTREKIDKITKKKTGETEKYTFTDSWYHPKLSQSLRKYLELKTCEATSIDELLETVLRVEKKIDELKSEHAL